MATVATSLGEAVVCRRSIVNTGQEAACTAKLVQRVH